MALIEHLSPLSNVITTLPSPEINRLQLFISGTAWAAAVGQDRGAVVGQDREAVVGQDKDAVVGQGSAFGVVHPAITSMSSTLLTANL